MTRRVLFVTLLLAAACAKRPAPPPIIVISIDTLRADHLSAYGYRAARTPNIDALAGEGIVYRNVWANCPLTLPSHLSILTGLLPPEHGVRDNSGYRFDAAAHQTLAGLLRGHGYRTGAAISAYVLRGSTGVSSGFDDYDDEIGMVDGAPLGALQRDGHVSEQIAERWIDAHHDQPFFYFLHLYEPHAPYAPTYDADVAAADRIVGTLIAKLKSSGVYDRAIVVLLSDHGEGLMDHGEQEHGVFLYREDLHVPLIVKLPGSAKRGSSEMPAQLTDVAPTVLDAVGIAAPPAMRGMSLLREAAARTLYAESFYPRIHLGWSELRSSVRGPFHVIDAPVGELYDLKADPAERRNIADLQRRPFAELRDAARKTGGNFSAPEQIDPEEAKKLAALGYVSAGSESGNGPLPDPKSVIGQLEQLKSVGALSDRGDHAAAIAALHALLAVNPRWSDVREQLGEEYERIGDEASAAKVYQEGIALTPRLAGAFALSAGFSLVELKKLDEAAAHAAIALAAGESGAHLLLGEIALARGDLDAAAREETAAAESASEKTHALFLGARIASARHDYAKTLELLDAVERERKATGASLPELFHYVAGDALARSNRLPEAEREFEREIAGNSRDARAYADLALIQLIGHRPDAAHATLERLAAIHPKPAVCLDIAKQLEMFGDRRSAGIWRERSRVAK
jgi:choline-sulfatase